VAWAILNRVEDKLKERLTGAAILVAFLFVVVPELFKGKTAAPEVAAANTPTPDNAAPQTTYQIDLQPGAGTPTVSAAAPSAATSVSAAAATPAAPAASQAAPAPAGNETPGAAVAATAPAPLPVTANAGAAVAANVAANDSAAARPAAARSGTKSPAAASPTTGRGWMVRLGVFSKRENAQKLHQQLQDKGVQALVSGPDARGFYSVHSAKLADRNAATDWQKRAKGLGFPAVLTEAP